jgi:DNA modification methylase
MNKATNNSKITKWVETCGAKKWILYCGDSVSVLKEIESESVNCIVTSPPYYSLRDYNIEGRAWHGYTKKIYYRYTLEGSGGNDVP